MPTAKLDLREALLLMEFHGSPAGVKEQAETVQEIASEYGGKALNGPPRPRAHPPVDGAAQRLLCADPEPRLPRHQHRHLRAHQPPGRLPAGFGGEADAWASCTFWSAMWATATSTSGYLLDPTIPKEREIAERN